MPEHVTITKSRSETIQELGQRISGIERSRQRSRDEKQVVSTGIAALDELLPAGGFRPGTLVEWLAEDEGCGAGTLALMAVAETTRAGGAFVVIDNDGEFHPVTAAELGIDPADTIIVRPENKNDAIWSLEQSLRCQGVAAAMGWVGRLDSHVFRRLQLAVETGGGIGFLMRPAGIRREASWADVRLLVQPSGSEKAQLAVGCVEVAKPCGASAQAGRSAIHTVHDNDGLTSDRRRTSKTACLTAPYAKQAQVAQASGARQPTGCVPNSVASGLTPTASQDCGFADLFESSGRRLRVELLYCRDGADGGVIELEVCHETGVVRVAPQLASPAYSDVAAGA